MEPVKDSELIVVDGTIYHLGLRPDQLARQVFLVGDPKRVERVSAHFDKIEHTVENREYRTHTGTYKGMPVSVISTGIGTDNVEIAMVEMYGLNEFDLEARTRKEGTQPLTIIRIGTSGGPQKDIKVGTLVISQYGLGLDNTGMFYEVPVPDALASRIEEEAYRLLTKEAPEGRRFRGKIDPYVSKATPEVVGALTRNAQAPFARGITASGSGFFGNQGREIPGLPITVPRLQEHLAKLNVDGHCVINFEMETSALCHLAQAMGYRAGTVCPIIANRQTGEFLSDYAPAVERAIQTALFAMLELYQPGK